MTATAVKMQPNDFKFLSELLKKHSGLALTPDKEYLLESRLQPIARSHGLHGLSAMVAALQASSNPKLLTEVIEAMTTNESLFFRDNKPFEHMKKNLLPALREQAKLLKSLRIWSAAASTGQEPYSVAITLLEDPGAAGWKQEIIATDIAHKVIDRAKQGIYSQFEVQRGLPIQILMKYFKQLPDTTWQIKDDLRRMVDFRTHNLLENFTSLGVFHLILCRNVLIYFDDATKIDIVRRMCANLHQGGFLIIGSSESVMDSTLPLKAMEGMPGIYQRT